MLEVSGMSFGMGRRVGRERVTGNFGYPAAGPVGSGDGELAEDEVWSIIDETAAFKEEKKRMNAVAGGGGTSSGRNRRWPIASSDGHRQVGGLSLAFQEAVAGGGNPSTAAMIIQQFRQVEDGPAGAARHSAPVNVPDWSKILRDPSPGSLAENEVSPLEEEREWVPPHEYLARESARQRGSATSVLEGAGRTLKGRDMSRVRNAVWSQTGFFG
uniref:Senescence regulator S40 n=2 Tax=Nymphaea colorata TaxID=210225 RepID=A0A5K0VMB9_9MAGN